MSKIIIYVFISVAQAIEKTVPTLTPELVEEVQQNVKVVTTAPQAQSASGSINVTVGQDNVPNALKQSSNNQSSSSSSRGYEYIRPREDKTVEQMYARRENEQREWNRQRERARYGL